MGATGTDDQVPSVFSSPTVCVVHVFSLSLSVCVSLRLRVSVRHQSDDDRIRSRRFAVEGASISDDPTRR